MTGRPLLIAVPVLLLLAGCASTATPAPAVQKVEGRPAATALPWRSPAAYGSTYRPQSRRPC